jgi:hypothetical protein
MKMGVQTASLALGRDAGVCEAMAMIVLSEVLRPLWLRSGSENDVTLVVELLVSSPAASGYLDNATELE